MNFKKSILGVLLVLIPGLAMASFGVAPAKLDLSKKDRLTDFKFRNGAQEEKTFQVIVMKKKDKKGTSNLKNYTPTDELIATPLLFTVGPDKEQVLRIGTRNPNLKTVSRDDYRIVLKELPKGEIEANMVRLLTQISMPVTINKAS